MRQLATDGVRRHDPSTGRVILMRHSDERERGTDWVRRHTSCQQKPPVDGGGEGVTVTGSQDFLANRVCTIHRFDQHELIPQLQLLHLLATLVEKAAHKLRFNNWVASKSLVGGGG